MVTDQNKILTHRFMEEIWTVLHRSSSFSYQEGDKLLVGLLTLLC